MTQNTTLSLIATMVIAGGFLVGWCAGGSELAPLRAKIVKSMGAGERSITPARESGNDGHARPVSSGSAARDPV